MWAEGQGTLQRVVDGAFQVSARASRKEPERILSQQIWGTVPSFASATGKQRSYTNPCLLVLFVVDETRNKNTKIPLGLSKVETIAVAQVGEGGGRSGRAVSSELRWNELWLFRTFPQLKERVRRILLREGKVGQSGNQLLISPLFEFLTVLL